MDFKSAKKVSIKAPSEESNLAENKENGNGNGPLSSHRDPRRTPLVSRVPFTPTPGGASGSRRRKEVTPAYAYKNAETGLLEIRTVIPPSLSIVANEDETVVGLDVDEKLCNTKLALYPIALNGGGAGLYSDPRAFANGTIGGFSNNHNTAGSRRAPLMSHVRFAWPSEIKNNARLQLHNRDLEMGFNRPPFGVDDDEMTHRTRHSLGTLASAMNPWKLWENVHNEMSRLAALRAEHLEDDASHVTLARQKNKVSRVSSIYNDDDFDFALVLTPHDAYAFWAMHLDFREEALHLVTDQDPNVNDVDVQDDDSTIATATCQGAKSQETFPALKTSTATTPIDGSGLRRRKNATPSKGSNSINQFSGTKKTPSSTGGHPSHRSPFRAPRTSERVFCQRKSVFERALDRITPPGLSQRKLSINNEKKDNSYPTPSSDIRSPSPFIQRRRWGNAYDLNKISTPNLTSPPIVSLKKGAKKGSNSQQRVQVSPLTGITERKVDGEGHSSIRASTKRLRDDEVINELSDKDDKFFSSPGLPRGIAARVNGLEQFLEALKIGVVVRRHWPRGKSVFVMLSSDDGGDSIQFKYIPDEEAVIALKEQAQRYDRFRRQKKARLNSRELDSQKMSRNSESATQITDKQITDKHVSSVPLPDYVKAKIDREEDIRKNGVFRHAIANKSLNWRNSFLIEAKDIVQVQPATHIDPFSKEGEKLGTSSLRQSNTEYLKHTTLSVIIPSIQGQLIRDYSRIDLTQKWCDGEHQSLFSSLDIELATEGEYWMMLKGFILLHRDASAGRFAAQRACGFGSYYRHADVGNESVSDCNKMRFTESLPPPKTMLQRLLGKNDGEQAEAGKQIVSAPPSDYFLGFSSPGTQIWGRLRQAGLETQRLYALDTRKVMIKVRCPVDRLQDVAEALKLKMKTKDGDYAPFREDMISQFASTDDGFVSCEDNVKQLVSLFRSSERQKIINFIIGSRIRDSGAELGPSTQLGRNIQRRVPLHSHARLEALYTDWVLYWRYSNWTNTDLKEGGTAKSFHKAVANLAASENGQTVSNSSPISTNKIPNILYRFFVGSFYQPLDSIEEYYGEKVAFYFAWLQHCSFHLLYLSVAGLVMFIIQITSGNWDHPLRPWFSILVMIWSFVVMVTWRRRSNFLAYNWGTLDYQEEEVARPEFKGTRYDVCPITNTWIPYYPPWKRWLKMCISIPLTVGFTMATLLGILILYGNRDAMLANYFSSDESHTYQFRASIKIIGSAAPIQTVALSKANLHDPNFWLIMTGFPSLLGLVLPLLNFCLRKLSLWLNEIENHRTEAEHQTHFILKVFAFRFVCYFAALYYYSFLGSTTVDANATEHGIIRVASSLVVYLTIAHWWSICLQVCFPLLLFRWRVFRERLRLRNELRSLEMMELDLVPSNEQEKTSDERLAMKKAILNKRLLLEHAQVNIWEEMMLPEHDSFPDYLFAVTHFAYVVCFSVVLPITPLIVLINHLVNMRLDAFKICRARCRPLSQKTGGIGVWNHVLHIVTVIAILTNCSLMALTSSVFDPLVRKLDTLGVFALAIGWEHLMLLLKYIMQLTVSSIPADVKNQIKRKKFDQERTRYTTLRAKKDRRSGSAGLASTSPLGKNCRRESNSLQIKTSPCPPIRESVSESYAHNQPKSTVGASSRRLQKPNEEVPAVKLHGKGAIVNVRTTNRHSQRQEMNTGPHVSGSTQKQPSTSTSRSGQISSRSLLKWDENYNPNVDDANTELPRQPSSSAKSPYRADYNISSTSSFDNAIHSNRRLDRIPSSNASPVHEPDIFRSCQQQQHCHHQGDIISPSSSISTIPAMPTPVQLNMNSNDDTLETVDAGLTHYGLYQGATAPPLSPPSSHGYVPRSNTSDGDDDQSGPKTKWGVHHSLQYAKSEKSLNLSEQKKSR